MSSASGWSLAPEEASAELTPDEVQLMRVHWPQKRLTYSSSLAESTKNNTTIALPLLSQPVTSSSVTFSLSRYDLRSQFVCMVLPQLHHSAQHPSNLAHEQLVRSPAYLAALLSQHGGRQSSNNNNNNPVGSSSTPMLKWLKLDVQGKHFFAQVVLS